MFIGFTLNVLLYGIMITQVYLYFTTYKRSASNFLFCVWIADGSPNSDKSWMKLFVCFFDCMYFTSTIVDDLLGFRASPRRHCQYNFRFLVPL